MKMYGSNSGLFTIGKDLLILMIQHLIQLDLITYFLKGMHAI